MLTSKIAELKKSIIEEADLVIKMMDICIQGLLERDKTKLDKILDLEEQVNSKEIELDEACTALIALHQPEAKNLRTILMILKMNNDLERMGDLVTNMSKCASYLVRKPSITKLVALPKMTEAASKMVKDSIQAFIDENAEEAKCVCEADDEVDDLKEHIYRTLITYMIEDPTTIKRAICINNIASYLERIADLSTNIAEETIFVAKGKIVKHCAEEE